MGDTKTVDTTYGFNTHKKVLFQETYKNIFIICLCNSQFPIVDVLVHQN